MERFVIYLTTIKWFRNRNKMQGFFSTCLMLFSGNFRSVTFISETILCVYFLLLT